jgi:ubiquinol-cytochrome c reductase cytochrome b subunit
MAGQDSQPQDGKMTKAWFAFVDWVDERFPMTETFEYHMSKYWAPKNFNFWYFFGVLSMVVLVIQLLTGIWLTMSYSPSDAFASVEYIMRDVEYGWLLRYLHSTGASAFFVVVYLHMFRGLLYGSYRKPRELLWLVGMAIFAVLIIEGFAGYLLPWGNMSFWAGQVIVSLVGAIPVVGPDLMEWVRGDFLMSDITLNRFFALHVVALPLVLVMLVFVHIVALHHVGSNNPDGVEIKKNKDANGIPLDGIPFHPYYTIGHDVPAIMMFLFFFCLVVFYAPEMGGYFIEKPNFEPANPLKTPEHIVPVWYYTPFYAMLRAATYPLFGIPAKFWGFVVMAGAIVLPAALPWLDRSPVKSIRYKGMLSKVMLGLFVVAFFVLGYLGTIAPSPMATMIAQIGTAIYFGYFVLMPWYTRVEKTKPVPDRVTMP